MRHLATNTPLFRFVFHLTWLIFLLAVGGHALKKVFPEAELLNRMAAFSGSLLVLWILLIDHKRPTYFLRMGAQSRKQAEKNIAKNVNPDDVIACIQRLMEEEKLYQVENLTLKATAAECNISYHDLSFLINQRLGMNFNDYVNSHRVRDAGHLLLEDRERKVIDIALDAGFSSVDTFNRAFRKFMGCTPSAHRKSNKTAKG